MRLLPLLGVAALASATVAQTPVRVDTITHLGNYDLATQSITSAGFSGGASVVYDNTAFLGSFFTPGPGLSTQDWGTLSAGGQNEVTLLQIAYATTSLTPIDINISVFSGTTGFGDQGALAGAFSLTGLAPSASGNPEAFSINVDLLANNLEFDLPDGPIGYSYEFVDAVSGPLLVGPPNEVGVVDAFDQYDLANTFLGTGAFPGGNPFASLYMQVTAQAVVVPPPTQARLMLSEFAVTPTAGEFVEIFNPNSFAVDLTDTYLTDATFAGGGTFYYQIVEGGGGGGGFGDFYARFPTGALIGPGEYQTIALAGSTDFNTTFGVDPTYEIAEDDVVADAIPDMLEARPGSLGPVDDLLQGGLTNFGEVVVLLHWDGESDLVQDLDYVVYGDKVEGIDKTGVSIDGPDADTDTSTYADDTAIIDQDGAVAGATGGHAGGNSWQRQHLSEGGEVRVGGNGLTGNDEMSEAVSFTWVDDVATPNGPATNAVSLRINPATPGPATVELRNATPNTPVFFIASFAEGTVTTNHCPGEGLGLDLGTFLIESIATDGNGDVDIPFTFVNEPGEVEILIQVVDLTGCVWSNVNATIF